MDTDNISELAYKMYVASLKHSTHKDDSIKLNEEIHEFIKASYVHDNKKNTTEEMADLIHMLFRWLYRVHKPSSPEHARIIFLGVLEAFQWKYNRQMNERGWNQ